MDIKDKIIVITGAGSGIGKALASKFIDSDAKSVVVVDINARTIQATADELGCTAMTADVSLEQDIRRIVDDTEKQIGPIDLFCSNAGVMMGESEQSPTDEWQLSWNVNVMPHVYAARYLVPKMIERGGGYFLNTASAAGLLNQIGCAAYGVSKHAAVGYAEWLALTYAHQGIKVSLLCPQAVRTPLADNLADQESIAAAALDGMLEPEQVADCVIDGLNNEDFLILPHPEVKTYLQHKTADYDRWIAGMNRFQRRLTGA